MVDFLAQGRLYARHLRTLVPTTTHIDVELEEREAACHSMGTYLDEMSNFSSSDEDEAVGSILDFLTEN
jgi:hypothetical protein